MKKIIGIIGGKGKMGLYFTEFFKRNGYEVLISDIGTKLSNVQLAKKADVLIVSVPIDKTVSIIQEVAPHVKKSGLLMDLTSVKVAPMEALKKTKASYLGCHPLFGPTAKLDGQIIILSKGKGLIWHKWLKSLLEKNAVIVRELTAKKHDEMMAYIQTLNHFSEIVLADALRKSGIPIKEFIKYPSPMYMMELFMMGRILNQDANLYANIQLSNKANFKVIQSYLKSARELAETIEKKDLKKNTQFFKRNSKYLGSFSKLAMKESDRLLQFLHLPGKKTADKVLIKPSECDIAILGPRNTYSDMALHRYSKNAKAFYTTSISEVFELVAKGKVKEGLVPIENTSSGSVRESLDELYSRNVIIEKMISQPVELALVGIKKVPLSKISKILSHAQPLLQSRQSIRSKCKKASTMAMESTTAALKRVVAEDSEDIAAIASPIAAAAYNLKVIQNSVEDNKDNTTHFALIKKSSLRQTFKKGKKTSIAFHFKKDSPGSLNTILNIFADAGINLTKIESRPNSKVHGEYVFYLDFGRGATDPKAQKVLKQVKDQVAKIKILGSY